MECSILSSLKLSKQKHNDDLNRRSTKRRALTYARRNLLDTKPFELSVASTNSSNDVDLNFIRIDDPQNLSLCNDTSDSSLKETVPNDIVELSIHEIVYDNISEVSVDEQSFTTLDEYFDFSLFSTEPDISLHNLTNVTKNEYCKALPNLFRDANVCKTHCDRFIQLISSGLPTTNHMQKSTKALLNEMQGILLSDDSKCQVLFYGIIGDCPALKVILEFIGHTGYHCCFYCYIHGIHVGGRGGKRQYYFENRMQLRTKRTYELESIRAVETSSNVYGHLGRSLLHDLLDVPLPNSIIVDYLHVSLLRHTRAIIQQVYAQLSPLERTKFDSGLRGQRFPHFFNPTELRNLLLYALIPHLPPFLPKEQLAHLSLYVCSIRIIHGKKCFGDKSSSMSKELFLTYYQDHSIYFEKLHNLVLHLHVHFDQLFDKHVSLCYLGTFGQEDLIGSISKNYHGTRFHGQLITYYYEIDFALRNKASSHDATDEKNIDGPLDQTDLSSMTHDIIQHHLTVYHSLIYTRRNSTISFLVQYYTNQGDPSFGKIRYFFTSNNKTYAVIDHHEV
ncbi:unnamed protein product [Rotaria socialis]|uniref:Uncharacterized protein n=1 Tax=Rotaria socialis TaxID=392032 RepID=A0A818N9I5_9BILA|nr:unnamed protein product [Rotaria socialis]